MKYSTTQPSTDPSAAMNAYSGIHAGCSIDSSISNRSLMTGKVSTEESRKEMRKSPGAPSPLAKATTFCFHPLRLAGTRHSSHQFMFRQHRMALFWSSRPHSLEPCQQLRKLAEG